MIRLLGQAGHKIIVADNDPSDGFSMSRFSRYVSKYINLSGSKSRMGYIEDLLHIWEQEQIHWFIPAHNKSYLYVADVEAKMKMKQKANFEGQPFSSLCINDASLAKAHCTLFIY